jgi:hypothetical protein
MFRAEKRRMFELAADEFVQFMDSNDAIGERGYRALLHKVGLELKRVTESNTALRGMVEALPRHATEDAVAGFVTVRFLNQSY